MQSDHNSSVLQPSSARLFAPSLATPRLVTQDMSTTHRFKLFVYYIVKLVSVSNLHIHTYIYCSRGSTLRGILNHLTSPSSLDLIPRMFPILVPASSQCLACAFFLSFSSRYLLTSMLPLRENTAMSDVGSCRSTCTMYIPQMQCTDSCICTYTCMHADVNVHAVDVHIHVCMQIYMYMYMQYMYACMYSPPWLS